MGKLAARWLEENSGGTTLGDTFLQTLRTSCRKGERDRPPEMDLRGINLSGEDLSGLDFSSYDLSGADLTGSNLSGSNLSWARLHKASLSGAQLGDCQLLGADLTFANLDECSAERAGFGASDLSGASLLKAHLHDVTLSESKLCQTDLRTADLQGSRFRNADLREANLTRADLRNTGFEEADVPGTIFNETDMRKARLRGIKNFEKASWLGTDISEVDFCGAYLVRRYIMDENYLYEFRSRSRYHKVLYWIWWLTSDCGRSIGRWVCCMTSITVLFAFLYGLVSVDYGDYKTSLSNLYYSFVTFTTLGYGDVVPASAPAQMLAAIEAVVGYVGLGGLLSILSTKMARRAD
jgi:uncharacterized protein YjbI with pentapeptide repeats